MIIETPTRDEEIRQRLEQLQRQCQELKGLLDNAEQDNHKRDSYRIE